MTLKEISYEDYQKEVKDFHGFEAPGLLVGYGMVKKAVESLPEEGFYDVICETGKCLPDAVQLLTPCSIGNGWLKIYDCGRFAFTFYNKHTGDGVRVFLDTEKMKEWDEVYTWFMKLKPKKDQDDHRLRAQIRQAGSDFCGIECVQADLSLLAKVKSGPSGICPSCQESYPLADGDLCRACQADSRLARVIKVKDGGGPVRSAGPC